MHEIEIISGTNLIERLNIPPYGLLDDLRYRGKFCPLDKKTGTPIPPPGHESEIKAILKLEKIVSEKEIALEMAVSEKKSALERIQETALESMDSGVPLSQSIKDLQRPYEARERGIEADLDLYRRQLALPATDVGTLLSRRRGGKSPGDRFAARSGILGPIRGGDESGPGSESRRP
ncbi:MAG: hypothetical protein ACLQVJ_06900 [Syntrophobacteraceae bacterium]